MEPISNNNNLKVEVGRVFQSNFQFEQFLIIYKKYFGLITNALFFYFYYLRSQDYATPISEKMKYLYSKKKKLDYFVYVCDQTLHH